MPKFYGVGRPQEKRLRDEGVVISRRKILNWPDVAIDVASLPHGVPQQTRLSDVGRSQKSKAPGR